MCIFLYTCFGEVPHKPEQEQSGAEYVETDVHESAATDELLDLVKDEELQAPEKKSPSKIMVTIRGLGIALITRYYAFKGWLLKKWIGEQFDEDDEDV